MKIGSLFSGIGGLELGLEWAGVGTTVWQVEQDAFCLSVLARHWPNALRFNDVRDVGANNLPIVDVICGGFPCQDISYAGKGLGLHGQRSGLWHEFARIIGEMGPRFVVVENVTALKTRGLDHILGTLASLGYDAEWRSIRASDVGAPHRRERIFILAYTNGGGRWTNWKLDTGDRLGKRNQDQGNAPEASHAGSLADSDLRSTESVESGLDRAVDGFPVWVDKWPSRPGQAQKDWEHEKTKPKSKTNAARVKALGNSVVPQVSKLVGEWLLSVASQ